MYVGNLETYQGIDLLLDSLSILRETHSNAELIIIGGNEQGTKKYQSKACGLKIDAQVHMVGPRPVAALGSYLRQADLLISPRIHGSNTPLKIYSYLDSGVAVVATALPTHTHLLTDSEAALTPPDASVMAATIARLLDEPEERQHLAANAQSLMRREHSWASFCKNVDIIFGELEDRLEPGS
jgi:glycosyltransferase involved in cell wall biosynthesis